jgi:hypothetical protein
MEPAALVSYSKLMLSVIIYIVQVVYSYELMRNYAFDDMISNFPYG